MGIGVNAFCSPTKDLNEDNWVDSPIPLDGVAAGGPLRWWFLSSRTVEVVGAPDLCARLLMISEWRDDGRGTTADAGGGGCGGASQQRSGGSMDSHDDEM